MFNATFNNMSIIPEGRALLIGRAKVVPRENHRHGQSYWQTLSHTVVSSTNHPAGIELNLSAYVVISEIIYILQYEYNKILRW